MSHLFRSPLATCIRQHISHPGNILPVSRRSLGLAASQSNSAGAFNIDASPTDRTVDTLQQLLDSSGTDRRSVSQRIREDDAALQTRKYFFHVYAHKHNTHITVCGHTHSPLAGLSLSTGNIGFRKSNRGTYEAAYQLASVVFSRMVEKGLLDQRTGIQSMEVIMRGFGAGREAITKAFLGQEGSRVRKTVSRVTDSTRLKFGGTRSEKPRRLG